MTNILKISNDITRTELCDNMLTTLSGDMKFKCPKNTQKYNRSVEPK